MKYHKYLDKFKNNNNDGENYSDIKEILDRFDTLKKEEKNLKVEITFYTFNNYN